MQIIQQVYGKFTFKTALLLSLFLFAFVVIYGVVSQEPVPVWWFSFTPILVRMLTA